MWLATSHGKDGQLFAGAGPTAAATVRRAMRVGEDLLSAMVFGRFGYLPGDLAVRLMLRAAIPVTLKRVPEPFAITAVYPWPNIGEESRVEPDWVLEGSDAVLVIEAKWGRGVVPSAQQLSNEWRRARATWPKKRVFVAAVCDVDSMDHDGEVRNLILVPWMALREQVAAAMAEASSAATHRILRDVTDILDFRGLGAAYMGDLLDLEVSGVFDRWDEPAAEPPPQVDEFRPLADLLQTPAILGPFPRGLDA